MKITTLDESTIQSIGHAFAYYDYGAEHGLIDAFPNREAVAAFICGYVRMALRGGILHATSEKHEGFIAYKLPGQKLSLRAMLPLAKGFLGSMGLAQLLRFSRVMSKGGEGLGKRLDKAKKPYIYVGLVCVPERYQGQGYMRKVLDLAFAEGDRLGVPVILGTDAKSKCGKYLHLGMELAGTRCPATGACCCLTIRRSCAPIRRSLPGCTPFFRRSALRSRSSSVRATAAWSRKFMFRNSPARPAG